MDELKPCPFCGYNMATEEVGAYQKAGFVGPQTPVWEVCCGSTGCNASVSTTSRESAVTAWNTRAASGGDSRSGDWVLVPRSISGVATDLLANFDMDSVGNNRGDAAEECWGSLIDLLGREPPELKFSNPVFHSGTNLTVRRGAKWHREEWAVVQVGDARLTVRLSCMTHRIAWLTDHWLRDEHDPACRTVAGLLAEMKRVYPGFSEHEEVTLVRFDVPAVNGCHAASGGDSASWVLERFGRAPAGSPYLLVPMDDGYWTPWHTAQKALDDSRLNEPFGNPEQLASLEQRARELYDKHTSDHPTIHCNRFPAWDELSGSEREKWRKTAALSAQKGESP